VLDDRSVEVPPDRPDIIARHGRHLVYQEAIRRWDELPRPSIPMVGQRLLVLFHGVSHRPDIIRGNARDRSEPIGVEWPGNRAGNEPPGSSIPMHGDCHTMGRHREIEGGPDCPDIVRSERHDIPESAIPVRMRHGTIDHRTPSQCMANGCDMKPSKWGQVQRGLLSMARISGYRTSLATR
jgi:hypothetical protein